MLEVTSQELMIFVVLGFVAGVFTSFYLTRLMEVVHMWRLLSHVLGHIVLMCVGIIEDIAFLKTLKKKQMVESGLTSKQIRDFEEVDDRVLTNWKNSVIISLIDRAPTPFRTMIPFGNWDEAIAYLNNEQVRRILKAQEEIE
ncbi:MAG TPA: hypothetical protein EYN67_07130 [Flavobacteriales bacterium]|nr:hypothetical protein [Flavobacteriales bacterium]